MSSKQASSQFARRMHKAQRSFIREILKVTANPEIISFAGGLPGPDCFPVDEIREATNRVLREAGVTALQYSTSEGYPPLREWVGERYRARYGLDIDADEVLITNGSQQGLDLLGKVFIDPGDTALLEAPGYLGAIQALGMYEPEFAAVPLTDTGVAVDALGEQLRTTDAKLCYTVPTFQNPSGITYDLPTRQAVARLLEQSSTVFVEDDPYSELRFMGEDLPPIRKYLQTGIMLGTFSKIVAPGLRLGWVCAGEEVMERLLIARQGADLQSNGLAQLIVHRYLTDYDLGEHIEQIRAAYGKRRDTMVAMIDEHFPPEVQCTRPEGGMFLWLTLPEGVSAMKLLELAIAQNVAFVPGQAFYVVDIPDRHLRLNFSNASEERIEEGILRLSRALRELLG